MNRWKVAVGVVGVMGSGALATFSAFASTPTEPPADTSSTTVIPVAEVPTASSGAAGASGSSEAPPTAQANAAGPEEVTSSPPTAIESTLPEMSANAAMLSAYVDPAAAVVQGFRTSQEQSDRFQATVGACMQRLGFEYTVVPSPPSTPLTRAEFLVSRRTVGFGVHNGPTIDVSRTAQMNVAAENLDAYFRALNGGNGESEPGGCEAEALMGQDTNDASQSTAVSGLLNSVTDILGAGQAQYAACMKARGYEVPFPAAASGLADSTPDLRAELALASADADCQQSWLWPAWDLALREIGDELLALS
ncbi:MAG: hypothetical protein ACK5OX_02185 [Desertimonas sp.]